MALQDPFMVYGYVKDKYGVGISGAIVDIIATRGTGEPYQGYERTVTIENGFFQVNIQNICDDGKEIRISSIKGSSGNSTSFILNVDEYAKQVDLDLRDNKQTNVSNVGMNISGQ